MKKRMIGKLMLLSLVFVSCNGQVNENSRKENNPTVGGGCDGCELMYIGMPENLHAVDTSPGWNEKGQKLVVTGTVFQLDGKTPAANVIIYYWQTNNNGYYAPAPGMDPRVKRHGHIRGWVKTGEDGKYTIRTIRPAPYPDAVLPAHIHLSVKEPDVANEYYTDELNFDDDPLLTAHFKKYPQEKRGGSGVVSVRRKDGLQVAEHDIILGLNIPDYPKKMASVII
ncbi:dioxygenase family protein [Niabella aquatica]